jgi:hypothetical protein
MQIPLASLLCAIVDQGGKKERKRCGGEERRPLIDEMKRGGMWQRLVGDAERVGVVIDLLSLCYCCRFY